MKFVCLRQLQTIILCREMWNASHKNIILGSCIYYKFLLSAEEKQHAPPLWQYPLQTRCHGTDEEKQLAPKISNMQTRCHGAAEEKQLAPKISNMQTRCHGAAVEKQLAPKISYIQTRCHGTAEEKQLAPKISYTLKKFFGSNWLLRWVLPGIWVI